MSYNRKAIADALSKMNKAKKPKQPKDIIKDPEGQYKYPGVPTRIASDNITMQGVSYPVLGVDNLGNQQMMQPGAEYVFPGADYVDEYPMMQDGGTKGNPPPTYADSLYLYNNAIAKESFYRNNPNYQEKKSNISFTDPKTRARLISEARDLRDYKITQQQVKEHNSPSKYVGEQRFKSVKGTGLTSFGDIVSYEDNPFLLNRTPYADTWFNPSAPPVLLHPNITPQGAKKYVATKGSNYGDESDIPYYDPIAVKPGDMLTDKELAIRIQKYGEQGIPLNKIEQYRAIVAKQEELIAAGYKIGKPDGIWGPKSEAAWKEYQNKVENQPTETSAQPNPTSGVPPLDVAPIDNHVPTPQTVSPQGSQQPPNTNQQAPAAPQPPSGYNYWTDHLGQHLDPNIYGWAPSNNPRQIDQHAQTYALKRANEAYQKLGATPWATEGNRLVVDMSKPYFSKTAATNALPQLAEQLGVPVDQLRIEKAPAGYSGYVVIQNLPQQKYGGLVTGLTNTPGNLLMNKKGKRMMAQSGSLSATNKMFLGNPMVTKRKKSVFVPGAPFQEGGNTSDPGMDAMMKARFAYAHMHGNPAAQRMTYPVDNPYIFTGTEPYTNPDMAGEFGTHYMFSQDNYAVPTIQQDEYGNLIYNPEANYTNPEAIQFDRPEDAEYFAEYYKQIAPGMQTGGSTDWKSRIASAMNFQKGGQMSREEFEKRKAAYKKLTGRDLTEKNVATIKQQQNLQKFIDDKKPLEKKLPTSEAEAMAMIESGELKIETIAQKQAREKREADARKADRIARLKAYEKRQADPEYSEWTGLPEESFRDMLANEAASLDAKFRFSQEDNFFDDYINPLVWIGSMAKNLGEAPQQAKQTGSLLPYITAVGTPLVMGAIGGAGATNTGQFVNNLVNPVAGLGTGMLNRVGRRSFTPYLDDIGSSLNPRTISNTPRQLPGSSNTFKSEIDWAKWNPDTPKRKDLIEEYYNIEKKAKANNTWMTDSQGNPARLPNGELATPEQWVQSQSKAWEKAYGNKGFENIESVYRGVGPYNNNPDFSKGYIEGDRGIFTADKKLAQSYAWGNMHENILNPFSPSTDSGIFPLMFPKGKKITYNTGLSGWTNVNLVKMSSKTNIEAQINRLKDVVKRMENSNASSELIISQKERIKQLQGYYNNFDKIVNDPKAFSKMRKVLGDITTTDNIAEYIPKTDLNAITLQNIIDGGVGDVTIVNNRVGNYLKSLKGNVGDFDMTNPNIYKALFPFIFGAGAASQYQQGGQLSKEEFEKRKAAYKKMTGRDFEPPKSFKPSEKARQQYQEKYNQQPVVQTQSAETVNQSRGVDTKREKEIIEAQANTDAKAAENYMHFYNKTYGSNYGAISYEQALQKVRLPNFDKTKYLNMYNLGQPKNEQLQSFREEDQANRTWEVITNPFTAFEYAVATGNMANMPSNINAARMQGYDVGVTPGRNMVGNALNMTTNLFDAGDKVIRNVGEGNYLGAGLEAMRFLPGARMQTQLGKKISNTPRQLPGSSNAAPAVNTTPAPWTMQEIPGLHLKSTMSDGAISKIVEPKTGMINVEQALGIIGKESGGADKVALIKQGLGNNIPKKMDYNEFRKLVQDQLIPLERQFATHSSDYGIGRLGYGNVNFNTSRSGNKTIHMLESDIIENQTLVLGNKNKFGRGSSAHGNPEETLGHIHFLRDVETPNILTVTQIQSDAFQGTHRIMPKNTPNATVLERQQKSLQRMQELQERNKAILNKMKIEGVDDAGLPVQDYQIKQFEDIVKAQEESNLFKKADIENFTQKQLLDKNHQERYLQELVDYAGKRGDVNKIRVPTSETAAKVQGYQKSIEPKEIIRNYNEAKTDGTLADLLKDTPSEEKVLLDKILKGEITTPIYSPRHQTILKKYSEQPKLIKKLFGQDAKIVTDSKGNTWYEFDIPKKFKEGKAEIKAFGLIPLAAMLGAASQYQEGGPIQPLDYFDTELTDQEIEQYKKGGCVVVKL